MNFRLPRFQISSIYSWDTATQSGNFVATSSPGPLPERGLFVEASAANREARGSCAGIERRIRDDIKLPLSAGANDAVRAYP
jgi:hypothetical protein